MAAVLAVASCSRAPERSESAPLEGAAPSLAAAPAAYQGYYDIANCNGIMAWAWDSSRPDAPIDVDVYDGSKKIATMSRRFAKT
jgi:hypothetical protein